MGRALTLPDIEPAKHLLVFLGEDPSQCRQAEWGLPMEA